MQELDMYQWILTKDSDWGEGYSSAEFNLNSQGESKITSLPLAEKINYRLMCSGEGGSVPDPYGIHIQWLSVFGLRIQLSFKSHNFNNQKSISQLENSGTI